MPSEQKPLTFSEVLRDRERLAKENERLREYKRNAKKQLRQLNAKVAHLSAAARSRGQFGSREEAIADATLMRRRAKLAEARVARLEAEREYPNPRASFVVPVALQEMNQEERERFVEAMNTATGAPSVVGEGENGKAAE